MSTNEKVRERRTSPSSPFSIGQETFARKESCFPRKRVSPEEALRQRHFNILDTMEADRDFCINDRVDYQDISFRMTCQCIGSPFEPFPVFRDDIENDITVH